LLFELKYHGNEKAGYYLGQILGITLSASALYDSIDVIVPIPLNEKKMRIRGYNQAALISRGIAEVWRKPVEEDAVSRNIFTESQTQKDRIQRLENMEGAFTVHSPKKLAGKHILLVDDIVTTGATLEACGLSILEIEETKLSVATVACTF
jgi:ComF family protein